MKTTLNFAVILFAAVVALSSAVTDLEEKLLFLPFHGPEELAKWKEQAIQPQQCGLNCNHGGNPNSDCTACENCLGAWTGPTCDSWDSNVPFDKVLGDLLFLKEQSLNQTAGNFKRSAFASPRLSVGLGLGVDITTGVTKLPVFRLNYPAVPDNTWTSPGGTVFQLPSGVVVKSTSEQNSGTTSFFEGMYDYVQYLYGFANTNIVEAPPGSFSAEIQEDLVAMKRQYFSGDSYMAVTKELFPVLDSQFGGSYQWELDPFANRAMAALPPDYSSDTNKAIYRAFIDYWGTTAISSAILGGMLDMQSFVQQSLMTSNQGPYTAAGIQQVANVDYYVNVWGTGSYDNNAQKYLSARRLGQLSCQGGNAAELCSPASANGGSSATLQQWKNSIANNPVPLKYFLSDFTNYLPDPQRSNIRQAIQEFLTEQRNKWTVNFPTCPECMWGTCQQGQYSCTCYNNHITGKVCDQCVSGWMNKMCTNPICNAPCNPYGGICVAPDTCQCSYPYYGQTCQPVCGDNIVQYPEQCDRNSDFGGATSCCQFCQISFGAMCRPAQGPCDEPEYCNGGFDASCPMDRFKSSWTVCKTSYGPCENDMKCDGYSANCPSYSPDQYKRGVPCGSAPFGDCVRQQVCDGYSANCPFGSAYAPYGSPCNCWSGGFGRCSGYSSDCQCS